MKNHKQIAKTFLLSVAIVIICCAAKPGKIVGRWEGIDNMGHKGAFIFDSTNHAVLLMDDKPIKPEFDYKYEMDSTKTPMWLDILIYQKGKTAEGGRLKGIVRFITNSRIEFRLGALDVRCDAFDSLDKQHTIILDKVIK